LERIVSLLPSLTEIACALGLRDRLVGRSHECDFPPGVETLPALTEPKFAVHGLSGEIDARVRELVREGLSVYRVDPERLRALRPDLILTQDHCEVCAVSVRDVECAVADWLSGAPQVLSVAPATLREVWGSIAAVAAAAGVPDRGRALADELTERVSQIGERAGSLGERPRLACVEWLDPLMSAGNWMPELVAIAGGRNVLGETGAHSPTIAFEALAEADPDVVLVLPCGFDLARTRAEFAALRDLPRFAALRAARAGRVYLADGNQYFNRPGPRLVESLEILAEILHPGAFAFGHAGRGYEPSYGSENGSGTRRAL
jgi:iron complex transport system substrate-binding protein